MAIGSGLGGSFGVGVESTYGTYAAPTRFYKATKSELKKTKNTVQGGGLAAGQFAQDGNRRVVTSQAATASVDIEVGTKGFGLLLQHILGGSAVPVQQASTIAYLQTHTLADNFGKSLTLQNGVPNRAGTIYPFTLLGGKVTSATIACAVNSLLTASVDVDGQMVVESQTLASPSYSTGVVPFHSGQMTVLLGTYGSEVSVSGVKGVTMQIERGQQTDAYYAGATTPGTKDEPVMNDNVKVTGSLDVDFKTKADFADRFSSDTPTSLILKWQGTTAIASTYYPTFQVTCPMVFFEDTPTSSLDGMDVVGGSVPFTAQFDQTNAVVSVAYMSSDTAI